MAAKGRKRGPVARLLDFAGNRRWMITAACACTVVSAVLGMVVYVCVWLAVRDVLAAARSVEPADIAPYGYLAAGLAAASVLLTVVGLLFSHACAYRASANIQKVCARHLVRTSLGWFDFHPTGVLRRRIDSAATLAETLVARTIPDAAGTVALFMTMIVLLVVFDWRLGLVCIAAACAAILAMMAMMTGGAASSMQRYTTALERLEARGVEYIRGISVVKVFHQTAASFTALSESINEVRRSGWSYTVGICALPQAFSSTIVYGLALVLAAAGLVLAPTEEDLSAFLADFVFYAVFSATIATTLQRIMAASAELTGAADAWERIEGILKSPVPSVPASPKQPLSNGIVFSDVSFTYEGAARPSLDHVSFTIEPGQTVALVGRSGSGKTTAARLVPRFFDAGSGTVRIGGADVRDLDPAELMDQVAYVAQNDCLFKGTVIDNVRLAWPNAPRERVLEALSSAQCDDIVKKLPNGADTVVGPGGAHLSEGERQRIALARVLLKDAPIVVLDEATAFIDLENEQLFRRAFARIAKDRTVLLVAHRLSSVTHADKIIVLDRGRVVEHGTHETLLAREGVYAGMWENYRTASQWRIERGGAHVA